MEALGFLLLIAVLAAPGSAIAQADPQRPSLTPFTVAPRLLNQDEVVTALMRSYPPDLREAGIGGVVGVWFFIDDAGVVANSLLDRSSGNDALDQAALSVAGVYRFSPALNRDTPVAVWVSIPVTFQVRAPPNE